MCDDCSRAPTDENIRRLESTIRTLEEANGVLRANVAATYAAGLVPASAVEERDAEIYRLRRQFQLLKSFNNQRVRSEHKSMKEFVGPTRMKCCSCVEDMRKYASEALAVRPRFLLSDWP